MAYIQNTLWAFRFNGKPVLSIPLTPHGNNGNAKEIALSEPQTCTALAGSEKSLYHFGAQGQWLSIHALSEPVQALSLIPLQAAYGSAPKDSHRLP